MDSSHVAWFNGNSGFKIKSVATLKPNDFDLFDMNGNAWEWCWDRYGDYAGGVFQDPVGSRDGDNHVIRGGSYQSGLTTVSGRAEHNPEASEIDIGFRLVRTAVVGNLPKE
jgi:formylglycine-generating enzyme required for sulfatase activity